jgi:hypothetical protein
LITPDTSRSTRRTTRTCPGAERTRSCSTDSRADRRAGSFRARRSCSPTRSA